MPLLFYFDATSPLSLFFSSSSATARSRRARRSSSEQRKVRQLKEGVICGFAGATADAMTLFERLEGQLQAHPETMRACVEMAKAWRMDKYLRRLEAVMIVCDKDVSLTLTGTGDVIEPADGVIGIGSGGHFATAAATALMGVEGMQADEIGRRAMTIAANMCVYTVRARACLLLASFSSSIADTLTSRAVICLSVCRTTTSSSSSSRRIRRRRRRSPLIEAALVCTIFERVG